MKDAVIVFDHFDELDRAFAARLAMLVEKTALEVETGIKGEIVAKHIIDTGAYLNSWETNKTGQTEAVVSSDKDYGQYQEYGTRYIAARPHIVPTADRIRPAFVAGAKAALHE